MADSRDETESEEPATALRPQRRSRPGGRTARVRRAVLDATRNHVVEHGLEGLTVAAIAARAGVAETTVYRRWASATLLIADAVADLAEVENPTPNTGSTRDDLIQLAEQIAQIISQPGIVKLLGAAVALSADPDVASSRQKFWRRRFELSSEVVERAGDRGDIRAGVGTHEVIETIVAPMYFRLLVTNEPIDSSFLARCIDNALTLYGGE